MKLFLVLGTALCLSSCVEPMTREDMLNTYRRNCLDYGFQWGTPQFAKCVKDQEYQSQKLSIEQQKAWALQQQARNQKKDQYFYIDSGPTYMSGKKHKSRETVYIAPAYVSPVRPAPVYVAPKTVKQKVKQKVYSTTNVHNTHVHNTNVHQTYQQPQSIYVQEAPTPASPAPRDTVQSVQPSSAPTPPFQEKNSVTVNPAVMTEPQGNTLPVNAHPEPTSNPLVPPQDVMPADVAMEKPSLPEFNATPPVAAMERQEMAPPSAPMETPREPVVEFTPPPPPPAAIEQAPQPLPVIVPEDPAQKAKALEEENKAGPLGQEIQP